jgi:hypothetical protein
MRELLLVLFPAKADNVIRGSRLPFFVLVPIAVLSAARSLIHLLAPDGGAGIIAGMDLSVTGSGGIVFAFGLWGSSQLLMSLVQFLVLLRYRSLVPLMYLLLAAEALLRGLVGRMKPAAFAHTPPGAIGNLVILPLAVAMLVLGLWSTLRSGRDGRRRTRENSRTLQ